MKRILGFLFLLSGTCTQAMAAEKNVTSTAGSIFHILIVLILVLGLMVGAAWLLKRFNSSGINSPGGVKVVGGVPVGNRERIIVVEVADQWIVVGVTPTNITALSTMPKQATPPAQGNQPLPSNFASKLKQLLEKRNV